jgi:hypothetical protein
MVRRPLIARPRARSTISRTSLTPPSTAENGSKLASADCATTRASVVFPLPGGPHNTRLGIASRWMASRRKVPSPSTPPWPTTSSRVRGRIRSARGTPSPPRRGL